jgi:GMP synthase-like glutamine amidotransferase
MDSYIDQMAQASWRRQLGYVSEYGSDFQTIHILLGRFLADRTSANPLPDMELFTADGVFEWGAAPPLEKILRSPEDLHVLMRHPELYRNSLAIIEPWKHVGFNMLGEEVRASRNLAYLAQRVANCGSILLPVWDWNHAVMDPAVIVPMISSGLAIIVEGGMPSVWDVTAWPPECPRETMLDLVERLLLSRSPTSAPVIFICLGHQLACEGHIRLIRRAIREVLSTVVLPHDTGDTALRALRAVCERIEAVGQRLTVTKGDGRQAIIGWNDAQFAVAHNESHEIGTCQLFPYQPPDSGVADIPSEVLSAHAVIADAHEGVIDMMIQYERNVSITMFHSEEANEEAVLFANWAYNLLHDAIIPYRHLIAASPLSWLIQLPYAIEILCSTAQGGEVLTEVACTCIYYKDFETKHVRRSFTCQFHPELSGEIRAIGERPGPSYAELKEDDGIRLLLRLLYAGMQE